MSESQPPQSTDAMDAVRELLLGQKVAEIDQRFQDQQQSYRAELEAVESRINQRFESLEQFVKAEVGSATEKITSNAEQTRQLKESFASQHGKLCDRLDHEFDQLNQEIKLGKDQARQDTFEKFSEMERRLSAAIQEMKQFAGVEVETLRKAAADRQRMGEFLVDLGLRVQSDDMNAGISQAREAEAQESVQLGA